METVQCLDPAMNGINRDPDLPREIVVGHLSVVGHVLGEQCVVDALLGFHSDHYRCHRKIDANSNTSLR